MDVKSEIRSASRGNTEKRNAQQIYRLTAILSGVLWFTSIACNAIDDRTQPERLINAQHLPPKIVTP
eukprot:scaffold5273_cov158-Skeletonema_menzelii.AAC.8